MTKCLPLFEQDTAKRSAKILVKYCVNHCKKRIHFQNRGSILGEITEWGRGGELTTYLHTWVESRVHISKPEGDGETPRGHVAGGAERLENVEEEEREPTQDEGTHDEP